MFTGLSKSETEKLKQEIVSDKARTNLTRLARKTCRNFKGETAINEQNRIINIARTVMGEPRYVLKADGYGELNSSEYWYHDGLIEVIFFKPDTPELVEILYDLIDNSIFSVSSVNEILQEDNVGVEFKNPTNKELSIEIKPVEDIEFTESEEIPNIRYLIDRMERVFDSGDYSSVLHTSASIFETLAKDIVGDESVQDESLGGWFEKFRSESSLPDEILNYIKNVYEDRNDVPLAGHGSLEEPEISHGEAAELKSLTKAYVEIERELTKAETTLEDIQAQRQSDESEGTD